jgi:hypothetical protein
MSSPSPGNNLAVVVPAQQREEGSLDVAGHPHQLTNQALECQASFVCPNPYNNEAMRNIVTFLMADHAS